MKITILSSLYGINGGGAGLLAEYLACGLRDNGHQVSVITLGENRKYSTTTKDGIKIHRFQPINIYPLDEKDDHPVWKKMIWQTLDIYNAHSARVLRKILAIELPDIIHIHKMRGFSGSAWMVAQQLFPGRVIQTCHDYESMSPDGYMRGSIGRMALRKQWPIRGYQLIRASLSKGISIVTAPSRFALNRIIESGLFPNAVPKVVMNTHAFSSSQLHNLYTDFKISSHTRFLYLGRLEREKGVLLLCEAFLQLFEMDHAARLDIAGWGMLDTDLREKYGNHPGINFMGTVSGKSKANLISQASVLVVPSLWEEVFGIVVIEAFAFGKPVIASNVGGLPELVREGETGWLVEAGNISALVDKLKTVTQLAPAILDRLGQACRDYSYQFSTDKIIAQYLDVYGQLSK